MLGGTYETLEQMATVLGIIAGILAALGVVYRSPLGTPLRWLTRIITTAAGNWIRTEIVQAVQGELSRVEDKLDTMMAQNTAEHIEGRQLISAVEERLMAAIDAVIARVDVLERERQVRDRELDT